MALYTFSSIFVYYYLCTVIPHLYPPPIVSQPRLYPRFSSGRISLIVNQYKSTSFVSHSDISLSPKFYGPDFPYPIINYYVIPRLYPLILHKISCHFYLYNLCQVCRSFTTFNKFRPQIMRKSGHINQTT